MRRRVGWNVPALALLLAILAGPAGAQHRTGNLYFTAVDPQGKVLSVVLVTLLGSNASRVAITDDRGETRFLALPPGEYMLRAERDGDILPVEYFLTISAGRNTAITMELMPGVIDVNWIFTGASPLLDRRNLATATTLSRGELEAVPVSHDPRALLAFNPDATVHLEGIEVREGVLDFAGIEEAEVVNGGSDILAPAGSPVVNLVARRGTNEWRGSARYWTTAESGIDQGVDAGGPLLRDRLWTWGSYARPEIRGRSLDIAQLKVDSDLTFDNALSAYAWDSDRMEAWKIEDTQMLGSTFYLTGLYAQAGERRPDEQLRIDAAHFFRVGPAEHELRYGLARATGTETTGLYVQDTIPVGPLTASLGLRWDRQDTAAGRSVATFEPRLGLTRLFGERDLLKASYARFAAGAGALKTDEILAGADHQMDNGLVVGLRLTWRRAPELDQELHGARLSLEKLFSERWMLRGQAGWDDGSASRPGHHWSYSLNGLYFWAPDRPWGVDIAFNLAGGRIDPLGFGLDTGRSRDVHLLDLRLQKELLFSDFGLTLGVDVFNVLDEKGGASPRSCRLGARLAFR